MSGYGGDTTAEILAAGAVKVHTSPVACAQSVSGVAQVGGAEICTRVAGSS